LELVNDIWPKLIVPEESSATYSLMLKLKLLKSKVIEWKKHKKIHMRIQLHNIEVYIEEFIDGVNIGLYTKVEKLLLAEMETKKSEILLQEEISWRLKSKDLWISSGDANTKFFHNYANYRNNYNSIWDIWDEEGNWVHAQD